VNRVAGSDGGGAEEQPRAPATVLRELLTTVQSLGCRWEGKRGTGVAVHGGSTTASSVA
jgi:hypothetical protein